MASRLCQKCMHAVAAAVALAAVCSSGCQSTDAKSDSVKSGDHEQLLGLSDKANQIERDLGGNRDPWKMGNSK